MCGVVPAPHRPKRNGKLIVPVLAIGGAISTSGPLVEEMMREVAEDVRGYHVPGTGPWIAEESAGLGNGFGGFRQKQRR